MSTPTMPALDELLERIVGADGDDALKAYSEAQRVGYSAATVIDSCRPDEPPFAWTLDAFFAHLLRRDGWGHKKRLEHTTDTVTVGDRDTDAHGPAFGRGPGGAG